jgi:GNAT superfamily N-acetyltransferase
MYMQRSLPFQTRDLPAGYSARPQTPDDVDALARLYLDAYPPGVAVSDLDEATAEMEAVFAGEFGVPLESASLVALDGDGELVGCVQTVERGVWEGTPDCPFVIELFVDQSQRGQGLGAALLGLAARACSEAGADQLALNVDPAVSPGAFRMYLAMGFQGS